MRLRDFFVTKRIVTVFIGLYCIIYPVNAFAKNIKTGIELRSGLEHTEKPLNGLVGGSIKMSLDTPKVKLDAAMDWAPPDQNSDGNWKPHFEKELPFFTFSELRFKYFHNEKSFGTIGKFKDNNRFLAPRNSPYSSVQWALGAQQSTGESITPSIVMRVDALKFQSPGIQNLRPININRTLFEGGLASQQLSAIIRVFKYTSIGANITEFADRQIPRNTKYGSGKVRSFSIIESEWDHKTQINEFVKVRTHGTALLNCDAHSRNMGFDVFMEVQNDASKQLELLASTGFRNIGSKAAPALHYGDILLSENFGFTGSIALEGNFSSNTRLLFEYRAIFPQQDTIEPMHALALMTLSHTFR